VAGLDHAFALRLERGGELVRQLALAVKVPAIGSLWFRLRDPLE
jgi:hypothetical protein